MALTMSFEFELACVFELRTYSKPSRGSLGPETAWPGFKSRLVQYLLPPSLHYVQSEVCETPISTFIVSYLL